ncbi:MAG: zinc-binding alcohol dehydrogenase family protein [Woeseiaceae bacterium]|nr:zinc-binding alcohol dehydrogenase family protein [Woeseiaceae bacterium]
MRAYVISEPGGPEKLELKEVAKPTARSGWVLIRNRAFGLNRSEWFTRRGDSPSVTFPRVLGIECVGEVVDAPGDSLEPGQTVAAMMGGMGRQFDGSYAEYVLVPRANVFPLQTELDWGVLGALPEMLQAVHGSLYTGLEIDRAHTLLVRGATSSIGFATMALARSAGLEITATTRNPSKSDDLVAAGATHVVVDAGSVAGSIRAIYPDGIDRVLELVGTTTLLDSLQATRRGGIVCMTGILGGQWTLSEFRPMDDVPTGVKLTSYSGEASDISADQLQRYVSLVESGQLSLKTGPRFEFDRLQEAHDLMDRNRANGKIVIELA